MASGNTLIIFDPWGSIPPASNYAPINFRNGHPALVFDSATEWATYFEGVLPRHYRGGGLTVTLHWHASATTNGVVWGVSFERHEEAGTDLDADSFASEKTVAATAPASVGVLDYASIAFSNGAEIDSLAVGEGFRIKVARKVADASDTMAANAWLAKVEIKET